MSKYLVTNKKDNEGYLIQAKDFQEVNTWVVNHLDLSKEWSVTDYLSRGWYKGVEKFDREYYESFDWFWDKEKGNENK